MLELDPIPAFNDNYIWALRARGSPGVVVVDPGEAAPVEAYLREHDDDLVAILITHHHYDHTGGVAALSSKRTIPVIGPANPAISGVTQAVGDGDTVTVLGVDFHVLAVPGHTLDHIAFHAPAAAVLLCGDTLFAAGCGRLFEGDAAMMHRSLQRLATLPPSTRVYCAHEYTLANLRFALAADSDNRTLQLRAETAAELRARGLPTLPSTIALERATNPFLRCTEPALWSSATKRLSYPPEDAETSFAALRAWKDAFQ